MDRNERGSSATEAFIVAFGGMQAAMWTALPGIINSFDPAKMTVVVQPAVQALVQDPLGNKAWQNLPLCLDVPVVYPGGGGCTVTFPLAAGDECLVVFASRCIDAWWYSGGVGVQAELRMHDLSDGFCIPGPRSQPRTLTGISESALQIRADDGSAYVEVGTSAPHDVKVLTAGNVDIEAPTINLKGNVNIEGLVNVDGAVVVTGTVTAQDLVTATLPSYLTHRHLVQGGPGTGTSAPIP
jgi:hypothetical protein